MKQHNWTAPTHDGVMSYDEWAAANTAAHGAQLYYGATQIPTDVVRVGLALPLFAVFLTFGDDGWTAQAWLKQTFRRAE